MRLLKSAGELSDILNNMETGDDIQFGDSEVYITGSYIETKISGPFLMHKNGEKYSILFENYARIKFFTKGKIEVPGNLDPGIKNIIGSEVIIPLHINELGSEEYIRIVGYKWVKY